MLKGSDFCSYFSCRKQKTDNVRLCHFMAALTLFTDDTGERIAQYQTLITINII